MGLRYVILRRNTPDPAKKDEAEGGLRDLGRALCGGPSMRIVASDSLYVLCYNRVPSFMQTPEHSCNTITSTWPPQIMERIRYLNPKPQTLSAEP